MIENYYIRNDIPMIERRFYSGPQLIAVGNEMNQPGDMPVSQAEYETALQSYNNQKEAAILAHVARRQEHLAKRAAHLEVARGKLIALGLSPAQSDAVLDVYPLPDPD